MTKKTHKDARKLTDIMSQDVAILEPETSVAVAAKMMRDWNVGAIPVCRGRVLEGIITDRDIVIRAVAEDADVRTFPIREVMTEEIRYCFDHQTIEEAAEMMEKYQIRRLPIVDQNTYLIGIISLGDLATKASDEKAACKPLEEISQPSDPAA